jgi:hypothetical protein
MKISPLIRFFFLALLASDFKASFQLDLRIKRGLRPGLSERLARGIISKFNLDKIQISSSSERTLNAETENRCDSTETITNYFFNVYTGNRTGVISQSNLETMIKFQVKELLIMSSLWFERRSSLFKIFRQLMVYVMLKTISSLNRNVINTRARDKRFLKMNN